MKPQEMNNHDLLAEYDEVRDIKLCELTKDLHIEIQNRFEELREEILSRMCPPYPAHRDTVTLPFVTGKDQTITKKMEKVLEEKGYVKLSEELTREKIIDNAVKEYELIENLNELLNNHKQQILDKDFQNYTIAALIRHATRLLMDDIYQKAYDFASNWYSLEHKKAVLKFVGYRKE